MCNMQHGQHTYDRIMPYEWVPIKTTVSYFSFRVHIKVKMVVIKFDRVLISPSSHAYFYILNYVFNL